MATTVQCGLRERVHFGKQREVLGVPDLIRVQAGSFADFLQQDETPAQRQDKGLQAAFDSVFPIEDYNGTAQLEFIEYSLGRPKFDVRECLERGMTFAASLRIKARLVVFETGEDGKRTPVSVKEQEVYLGELPLMTTTGTFIINGTERVVVSQLHRSPGVFFSHDKGKTHSSGKVLFSARVIPYRGSWLDFEFDAKDHLYVRIDRRRKLPATVLLKAFGYSTEQILEMYYPVEEVRIRNGAVTADLSPEVHAGLRAGLAITHPETGDVLVKEGNKITKAAVKRMEAAGITTIPMSREGLVGRVAAHDITRPDTGEVIVARNVELTEDHVTEIFGHGIDHISLLFIDGVKVLPAMRDTLALEEVASPEEAKVEIYKRIRPGETPTVAASENLFVDLFLNPKRYDLSQVGRLKLNAKLGVKLPLDHRTLDAADVVEVVRYLVSLRSGRGEIDDIDHLGNRRVRAVGELLENQFRIGLVRMERTVKERMNLVELPEAVPHDVINAKPVSASIKEFFGSSQLSQFMDQTNPLSEITHKRRLSALGPGGLTRERAGFDVRDVHPTHYGRICPIETPEGPNIGLITSLATYARINQFGFIESPYRKVVNGLVTDDVVYLSAVEGETYSITQANTPINADGSFTTETVLVRSSGDFLWVRPEEIDFMDVSPRQIVSVATALIPFLENDDANRALMGSNMQRQAVPLLQAESPIVGTGIEHIVARDCGYVLRASRSGMVESVDASRIVIRVDDDQIGSGAPVDIYSLIKWQRSNQNTCMNQKPLVSVGQRVEEGQILCDGPSTEKGELALGKNVLVAFMPWEGYNYEDAILLSERLVRDDVYTSVHIEEFTIEARDTKLGPEEITRDIPNVGEEILADLDESGIIRIGAEVKPGSILVGKVTPKGETQLTPEEKLLRAIFGEKAGDVKDASLYMGPGTTGVVVDVKIFSRKGTEKDERSRTIEFQDIQRLERNHRDQVRVLEEEFMSNLRRALVDKESARDYVDPESGEVLLKRRRPIEAASLSQIPSEQLHNVVLAKAEDQDAIERLEMSFRDKRNELQTVFDERVGRLKKGDELPPGVLKLVKVYVAMKRKIQVGDKMAGRHGNKGVVSRVLPVEDMPYLPDGTPVDIVLNPLGVPSRMNVGQILEAHLGWAARALGVHVATPVFDGAKESEIKDMLDQANLPSTGQVNLRDGKTGDLFERPVTVGQMYILKLHHLVDDKIHARSIGPYSLVTQQPLGGKAQFGGQRLGEMEVWALQAHGAASTLQEFLTVKSDDVPGRSKMYESIVKGEPYLESGIPESFNVLIKELQALGLEVELLRAVDT
ncbi:MAG: DNA-directed RNA polymerase subunit beta [Nitrospirota bacterium]|nr:DNA-directed RNA polymerase subunit beta [Nitrospirota bacterium]